MKLTKLLRGREYDHPVQCQFRVGYNYSDCSLLE
jgi:hypothetical protein